MDTYIKDCYGEMWKQDGAEGAYRRCSDKFRMTDLEQYNHSIHSVTARNALKKNICKERRNKIMRTQ